MRGVPVGRAWRTLRPLSASQLLALLRQRTLRRGPPRPVPWTGPALSLREGETCVPFLGAPAHARLIPEVGHLRLLHREVDLRGGTSWEPDGVDLLWKFHLHQHDFLRAEDLGPRTRARWILAWIRHHRSGTGWSPHPTSLRVLTWARLLRTPGALALSPEEAGQVRASLGSQLRTLERHLESHLRANHYLSNLMALVAGGLLLAGPDARRWLGFAPVLRQELAEQILPDGAHVERSPMYHALLLESLLDLLNLARVPGPCETGLTEHVALWAATAARMLGALRVWTHPDGRIALVGDAAFGIAPEPAALVEYASALGVEQDPATGSPSAIPQAGYYRLEAGPFSVLVSAGAIRPAYQPGHAHADALSFELCVGRTRVVTDTGVAEYVPGIRRTQSRATRSHATVEVGGWDQAELWAAHRVGGRPRVNRVDWEPGRRLEATCTGWATPHTTHRRAVHVAPDRVEVVDRLEGRPAPVRLTLPLAPELDASLDGRELRCSSSGERLLQVSLPAGPCWRLECGPYFPEFGLSVERWMLVGDAPHLDDARWVFRSHQD